MSPKEIPKAGMDFEVRIPPELVKEFSRDLRIVIRHPWIVGIPVPNKLISKELLEIAKGQDIFIVPRAG